MSNQPKDRFSEVLQKKASVVISDKDRPGGLSITEVLAWRHWFKSRQRQLRSSGGRPTNPSWTMKRQVPFSPETWRDLEMRAEICSGKGKRIGPGQLAAFLIEDAVLTHDSRPRETEDEPALMEDELDGPTSDPRYDQWQLPDLFAGSGAR